jgi:alginate O-acetyltransferase complex protein AlgJ
MQQLLAKRPIKETDQGQHLAATSLNRTRENVFTVAPFLLTIFMLASLTWIIEPPKQLKLENRERASLPRLNIHKAIPATFSSDFTSYFNDRFALRTELLTLRSKLFYLLLHETGSNKVIAAQDGWLFLGTDYNIESFRNSRPYTEPELQHLVRGLEKEKNWLAKHNIRYLLFIAPGKPTIYPEYVPRQFTKLHRFSRLDQLIAYVKEHSTVDLIDLRPALFDGKKEDFVYYKADSHWNAFGSYISYQQIGNYLSKWFPLIHIWKRSEFKKEHYQVEGGGLALWLGLNGLLVESAPTLVPLHPRKSFTSEYLGEKESVISDSRKKYLAFATAVDDPNLPKAIILRDSFADALQPFLSEHFRRIVYLWRYDLPVKEILAEKPDVVIQEMVERALMFNYPPITDDRSLNDPAAHARLH